MSIFSRAFNRLGDVFRRKPKSIVAPPIQPPKPTPPPKQPPAERYFEIVLHKTMTRGGKSRVHDKDRIELRVTVKGRDIDDARHNALRVIGSRVPDGYIQFFERIGLYNNISVSERSAASDEINLIRHSNGVPTGETKKW